MVVFVLVYDHNWMLWPQQTDNGRECPGQWETWNNHSQQRHCYRKSHSCQILRYIGYMGLEIPKGCCRLLKSWWLWAGLRLCQTRSVSGWTILSSFDIWRFRTVRIAIISRVLLYFRRMIRIWFTCDSFSATFPWIRFVPSVKWQGSCTPRWKNRALENDTLAVNRPRESLSSLTVHVIGRERKTIWSNFGIIQAATNLCAIKIRIASTRNEQFQRKTLSPTFLVQCWHLVSNYCYLTVRNKHWLEVREDSNL